MSNKKAVVCTILFIIVLITVTICSALIKTEDGAFSLFTALTYIITGLWMSNCVEKFYKWVST